MRMFIKSCAVVFIVACTQPLSAKKCESKTLADENKKNVTRFIVHYKSMNTKLKSGKITSSDTAYFSRLLEHFSKMKNCEDLFNVKREWFVRMAKGTKLLSEALYSREESSGPENKRNQTIADSKAKATSKRLMQLMSERKTLYAVEK